MKTITDYQFSLETTKRLQTYGESLHGLASVQAHALSDGSITCSVEYFSNDATREGCGDAIKLFEFMADLGLESDTESPAQSRGAFGPIEIYLLR